MKTITTIALAGLITVIVIFNPPAGNATFLALMAGAFIITSVWIMALALIFDQQFNN
jgi:uncharacterized membrane protein HdeD (DUF308 family)